MSKIQKIDYNEDKRVDTGPIQFGEDWPGYFIRGDDIARITRAWEILKNADDMGQFYKPVMQDFINDLGRAVLHS